jgi:hypothetical protein
MVLGMMGMLPSIPKGRGIDVEPIAQDFNHVNLVRLVRQCLDDPLFLG